MLRDRENLIIRELEVRGRVSVSFSAGESVTLMNQTVSTRIVTASAVDNISKDPRVACLDAEKVGSNLILRPTQQGDRFVPFGVKGSKLVSRYMIDHKFSAFQKERQLVITNGTEIVWLVGQRPDDRYRVVKETKNILIIETIS